MMKVQIHSTSHLEKIWQTYNIESNFSLPKVTAYLLPLKDDLVRFYEKSSECDVALLERILEEMDKTTKNLFENEIEKINGEIKGVCNHLSLAFFETNKRILFLGDLEKNEIAKICDKLESKGISNFEILITPHHGTHWHDRLKNLKFEYSVSSIGDNLTRYFKQQFLCVSQHCLLTSCFGDLIVP